MDSPRRAPWIAPVVATVLVAAVVVAVIALLATRAQSGLTSAQLCKNRLTWATGNTSATLLSVTALDQRNAWAVGVNDKAAAIAHWDGRHWSNVVAPASVAPSSALKAISAVNARDIWAVGRTDLRPLILHWNGRAWSAAAVAPVAAYSSQLSALAIVAADDIWAVGSALATPTSAPSIIAEHWDGQAWRVASAPHGKAFDALAASSAGDVWGLMTALDDTTRIVHWDGKSWKEQAPDSAMERLDLHAIAVGGDRAVWVAGSYWPTGATWAVPLVERWDGASWSVVRSSEPEARGAWLTSLTVAGDGTVWAAGTFRNISTRLDNALLERLGAQDTIARYYPSFYNDPDNGSSFDVTGMAVIPGTNGAWVIGATGSVPNPYRPPIDSNLPAASGGFILAYC